jgi:hypothetical protein
MWCQGCSCRWGETMPLNCGHQRANSSSARWYEYGELRWNDIDKETRKTVPEQLCPHGLTRARTRDTVVKGRRLTVWATARPMPRLRKLYLHFSRHRKYHARYKTDNSPNSTDMHHETPVDMHHEIRFISHNLLKLKARQRKYPIKWLYR